MLKIVENALADHKRREAGKYFAPCLNSGTIECQLIEPDQIRRGEEWIVETTDVEKVAHRLIFDEATGRCLQIEYFEKAWPDDVLSV